MHVDCFVEPSIFKSIDIHIIKTRILLRVTLNGEMDNNKDVHVSKREDEKTSNIKTVSVNGSRREFDSETTRKIENSKQEEEVEECATDDDDIEDFRTFLELLRQKEKQPNKTFTEDKLRDIQRTNVILMNKILKYSDRPNQYRTASNTRNSNKMTSTAINRRKQQQKINHDNLVVIFVNLCRACILKLFLLFSDSVEENTGRQAIRHEQSKVNFKYLKL